MLMICLVTLGDPETMTGGYRYQRRMANLAMGNDARITFVSLPRRAPFLFGWRALRAARSTDVVLVDSIAAAYLAPWIAMWRRRRRRRLRLAAIVHQPPGGIDHSPTRRRIQAWLDRFVYKRCDRVMVASALLAEDFEDAVVVLPGRDRTAGTDVIDLRNGAKAAALCVANWLPNKGILELLNAAATLPKGMIRVHLAGNERPDTAYGQQVIRRASEISDRVSRHGPCDDAAIGRLYRSADMFVLPSRWETFGTVYAEALDAGLPVIGWRSGNLPHLVDDGKQGMVLTPGDVAGLARALRMLAEDEMTRSKMAAAAADRARKLPTWDESAQQFFSVLASIP